VDRHFTKPATVNEAARNRERTLDEYLAQHELGAERLRELLTVNREFQGDRRVVEAMTDLFTAARFGHRGRGQPRGMSPASLLRRTAIARLIEGARRSLGMSAEEILRKMADKAFEGLGYSAHRNNYYSMRRHAIDRPYFFTRDDQKRFVRRRWAWAEDEVFVVKSIRIMPATAVPTGARLRVRHGRGDGCIRLDLDFRPN
jgi:hypothetical protein